MNSSHTMLDAPSAFRRLHWPVAIVLALSLAGLWLAGYGPGGRACLALPAQAAAALGHAPAQSTVSAVAPTSAAAASGWVVAAPAIADVAPAAARIYFASGRADVNAVGQASALPIVNYLQANAAAKVQISGFHDPRGNKIANEELALSRARAVRALLEAKGIAKERVIMAKPVETSADSPREEARRVEMRLLP